MTTRLHELQAAGTAPWVDNIRRGWLRSGRFRELLDQGVIEAADQMEEIYERTGHLDGRVSFELPPHMANDTEASTRAAAEFFERIDRPNAFIKIPGTSAGPKAIEDSIAAGISVNVTLLFSVESYRAIHEAY